VLESQRSFLSIPLYLVSLSNFVTSIRRGAQSTPVRGLLNIHFVGELTGGVSIGELLRDLEYQSGGF
jgi:hypothetical protein